MTVSRNAKGDLSLLMQREDVRCYVYPFPTGRLYIFGDGHSLKLVQFVYEIDAVLLKENFRGARGEVLAAAIEYLDCYLTGKPAPLPDLDLTPYTDREKTVYSELLKIPFGKTVSYGELARRIGIEHGGRFVGNAMAKNRFPIFIPCHRVVRAGGDIGNYSAGISVKRFLLGHESAINRTANR
jgi:methylated-DNA-[protein]-cysteine S-methyltransferase